MRERYVVTDDIIADKGLRVGNFLIDIFARVLFSVIVLCVVYIMGFRGVFAWLENAGAWGEFTLGIVTALLYFNLMEIPFGVTIGKLITGTVVVDQHGEKPDSSTILTRSLCRIIPFEALSFLGPGRGWHDSIPDVYVVRKRALQEALYRHAESQRFGQQ